ncbi:MAG: T9SS type A sorting domain-containing protein [Ferruginibacter sp.]|nr:T9SS type A sorting domain-containing protein [Ferruginibacter sp.]
MKKFYTIMLTVLCLYGYHISNAQCNGVKGPNLLAAKGTFSAPFITVNTAAENCTASGSNSFNPTGNVGNALLGCSGGATAMFCSDYLYTDSSAGLEPEFRYSILKTIGDNSGGNCIKWDWKGSDHTGDGGYFMAVNGAPSYTFSPLFYQVKEIPVCIGATYELSAWVINLLPASSVWATPGTEANVSFKINGNVVANSGTIAYNNTATWFKVTGTFVATTSTVNLEVVNATSIAIGNDLGIDDISINVCESRVAVTGPTSICDGNNVAVNFVVTDPSQSNTWYKWQESTNGGISFTDITTGAQQTYIGSSYTLINNLGAVNSTMNGKKYRLVVSTSQAGLSNPACIYYNDYTLFVADCGPLPVQLTSFNGRYSGGIARLEWQTSQEINSDRFELLRSSNGLDFIKAGTVKSAGNSNTIQKYSYQDNIESALGKYVYYRLKQVDIDGKATFSSIVKLSLGSKSTLEIFPNPFSNNFTVSFSAVKTSAATVRILNSAGKLVYTKTINITKGNNSVLMNSLPILVSGVYFVSIYNEELNFNTKLQKL